MEPLRISHLTYLFNYEKLNSLYDFYEVKTSQTYFESGSYLLDNESIKVKAISFYRGNRFLMMMDKSSDNDKLVREILSSAKEAKYLSFEKKHPEDLEKYKLAQLLLNGIGNYNSEQLKFNNLTGHLYCFHPSWLEKRTKNGETAVFKIPTLEIAINSEDKLTLSVHTFTSELLKKKIEFKKKKFEEYPKYILSAHYTLRRKLSSDSQPGFLMRQERNHKKEITFLDVTNYDKFNQSKMGVLNSIIGRFKKAYEGIAEISFAKIDDYTSFDINNNVLKENKELIKQELSSYKIKIIDYVGTDTSDHFCKELQRIIKEKYKLTAIIGKRAVEGCLNICVIHNAEYYGGVNDPHQTIKRGIIQHVTIEDFMSHAEQAIQTVFNELLIKADISENRIRLFDWKKLNQNKKLCFGISHNINEQEHYFFMDVDPTGAFNIHEEEYNLFNEDEYTRMTTMFKDSEVKGETVFGVINYNDYYLKIIDSNLFSVPDLMGIREQLKKTSKSLSRSEENRKLLLNSMIDIKGFDYDGGRHYLVGSIGYGMNRTVGKAATINRIVGECNDDDNSLDWILPLMSVTFVRNGQLTVLPFPFKYLREYVSNYHLDAE